MIIHKDNVKNIFFAVSAKVNKMLKGANIIQNITKIFPYYRFCNLKILNLWSTFGWRLRTVLREPTIRALTERQRSRVETHHLRFPKPDLAHYSPSVL
jgi:hypothetical protein